MQKLAAVKHIPRSFDEALRLGFELGGSADIQTSHDYRQERGSYDLSHPDGTCLSLPFQAQVTFGIPKLDRKSTRWAKDRLVHPQRYDSTGMRKRRGSFPSQMIFLGPDCTRILVEDRILEIRRKDGALLEYPKRSA